MSGRKTPASSRVRPPRVVCLQEVVTHESTGLSPKPVNVSTTFQKTRWGEVRFRDHGGGRARSADPARPRGARRRSEEEKGAGRSLSGPPAQAPRGETPASGRARCRGKSTDLGSVPGVASRPRHGLSVARGRRSDPPPSDTVGSDATASERVPWGRKATGLSGPTSTLYPPKRQKQPLELLKCWRHPRPRTLPERARAGAGGRIRTPALAEHAEAGQAVNGL